MGGLFGEFYCRTFYVRTFYSRTFFRGAISYNFDAAGPRVDLLVEPDFEDPVVLKRCSAQDQAVVELLVGVSPGSRPSAFGQHDQLATLGVKDGPGTVALVIIRGHGQRRLKVDTRSLRLKAADALKGHNRPQKARKGRRGLKRFKERDSL